MIIVTDASNKSSICCLLISLKQQEVAFATSINQAYSEYKHSLAFRFRHYVVRATKPMYRLQMRQMVHN